MVDYSEFYKQTKIKYKFETKKNLWNLYFKGSPVDSILEAVLTVSPNKQNRGIFLPTTPEHTGPLFKNNTNRNCVFN